MPNVFQSGNDELKTLCESPSCERLWNYFDARTAEWPYPCKYMECFTVGVFFDLSNSFENAEAFDLLKMAAQFPWDDLSDQRFLLAIDLLSDLATASNTTEMPELLTDVWDVLSLRVSSLDAKYIGWTHLVDHYKLKL